MTCALCCDLQIVSVGEMRKQLPQLMRNRKASESNMTAPKEACARMLLLEPLQQSNPQDVQVQKLWGTSRLICFSRFFRSELSAKLFSISRVLICSMGSRALLIPLISSLVL